MSPLNTLKSAASLTDLAKLLQAKPSGLSFVVYRQSDTSKYQTFEIPKRNGGRRIIKAPEKRLKLVQKKLSVLLQDCLDEIIVAKQSQDKIAHGFKRHRSIITNAMQHRHRRYVFNIDLEDFFPSINFGRVRGFFIRDRNFALNEEVATVIAQIACHENALPQGSPCSPVISNLIAHVLDIHLVRLASSVGCTYSRYADDLTFSTNKKEFPVEIARPTDVGTHLWHPGTELERIVTHAGFRINSSKTRMQYHPSRQEVTGLVVNDKVNVRREYRHTVRAMVHHLFRTGQFEIYAPVETAGVTVIQKRSGTLNELHGRLGFIDSIDLHNKNIPSPRNEVGRLSSKESMYRQFLIYRDFYATDLPVVLCEGETDNVYLIHAIRSLAGEFPELAEIAADGKIRLKIRLYKYRYGRSSTARVLGLGDGSGSLNAFIGKYKGATEKFSAPGLKQPVITLYDKDSGATQIEKIIKERYKVGVKATDAYVHVVRNLYAVPTPLVAGATESKIEDFFDTATKAITISGKTFHTGKDFDPAKHYDKKIFAYGVVRPRADEIDFTNFRPLLTNLTAVIKAHSLTITEAARGNA
jgi:retron-type reverse transcriptase